MFNKYCKTMKHLREVHKGQSGMTGLETAIILIAFVTVAAVFGYAVLSAGLFSAERGKETVYAGLDQAKSNLEISGSVIAKSVDNATVDEIHFTVKNAIAGKPIDMTPNDGTGANRCVISVRTDAEYLNNVEWSYEAIGETDGDDVLEPGEQFEITIVMSDVLTTQLGTNDKFAVQLKPGTGSTSTVERTLPPDIDPIMDLF